MSDERPKPIKTAKGWICSKCRKAALFDRRCGDGPILLCDCDSEADAWSGWLDR